MKLASSFLTGSLLLALKEQTPFAAASATRTNATSSTATNTATTNTRAHSLDESSYFSASNYTPPDDIDLFEGYFSEEDEFIAPFDEPNVLTASEMLSSHQEEKGRDSPRKLSAATAAIGDFYALDCNANLATQTCTNLDIHGDITGNLDIACGQCKIWNNSQDDVTISGGINILGKLFFPTNHKVSIRTKYVIVQGEVSRIFFFVYFYVNNVIRF